MKTKIKKAFHILLALMLACILFNECSVSARAYASAYTDLVNTTTRYIDKFFDFYEDNFSTSGYKGVWIDKTIADLNRANSADSGELKSYPLYCFTGKVINDYFNINNSVEDVEARDINYIYISTSTNLNPTNRNPLSGYSHLVPQEFYSGEDVPQIGTFFILRTHVDLSSGEVIDAKRYALVPLDYMPNILYYANGDIRIYFSGRFRLYIDGVLQSNIFNYSDQGITFYNSTVNSSVYRNGLSFYPNDIDYFRYNGNWERWYITDISTNNTDFYDDYTNTLNTVFVDTPSAKPPVSLVGLPMGTVITEETVNNYNYITYTDGSFKLDTYELGLDFDANIKPQIQLDFDNVFKSQPLPGLNFDSDVLYNYIDLFSVPITSDYIPSEWLEPYPPLTLDNNLDFELSPVPTNTIPADTLSNMGRLAGMGWNFYDALGLASPIIAIAVLSVLIKKIT